MAKARIAAEVGRVAVAAAVADGDQLATASRYLLQLLDDLAPGNTLEVRVPPYGAVQVVEGPRHTRGTPPNVIEMDATTWVALTTGSLGWDDAIAQGRVSASGQRADLRPWLPIAWA
ncbi:MAG: sterol carrier family protein [Pseudolysinimonas sp.]